MLRKSLILVLTGALTGLFSSISQGAETLSVATDAIAADFYPATQAGPQYGVLVLGGQRGASLRVSRRRLPMRATLRFR
jgi:hypothetical protein